MTAIRAEFTGMLKKPDRQKQQRHRAVKIHHVRPARRGDRGGPPRLERVEADVTGNLKRLGVPSVPMDGQARLAPAPRPDAPRQPGAVPLLLAGHPQNRAWHKGLYRAGQLRLRQSRTFRIGQYWGAASYLQILASELSDKLLAEILELDAEMTVTLHIQTVDQLKAIKTIKGKLSDIGKMKVEEQRKAVRAGYDPDILPPDLITFSKDAAELLADLQSRNERMFLLTFTVINIAPTRQRWKTMCSRWAASRRNTTAL